MENNDNFIDIKIIWKVIHNQATWRERAKLETWLQEDEKHQRYYNSLRGYYERGSIMDPSRNETEGAWNNVKHRISSKKTNKRRRLVVITSVAASLVLTFIFFYNNQQNRRETPVAENVKTIRPGSQKAVLILDNGKSLNLAASDTFRIKENGASVKNVGNKLQYTAALKSSEKISYNTLKVPRGGEYYLVLADGTKVWLNSESTLRYPVKFADNERQIELTGEAYFEVIKNKHKPFRVVSGKQIVTVLGTHFNISSYPEDSVTYTTLIEGHVNIQLKGKPNVQQSLVPNEQSVVKLTGNQITKRVVDPTRYVAWKNGRFIFKDERLDDMMNTLSRWYDVHVVFSNQRAKQIQFTGNLERYSDFSEILNLIEKTDEVKFTIKGNLVTVD